MEHFNPLLLHNDSPAKFITIGEVMLRLTPPNYEKIRMASNFEASYGAARPTLPWLLPTWVWTARFFQRGAQQLFGQKCGALAALQ
mgnify:FL=1